MKIFRYLLMFKRIRQQDGNGSDVRRPIGASSHHFNQRIPRAHRRPSKNRLREKMKASSDSYQLNPKTKTNRKKVQKRLPNPTKEETGSLVDVRMKFYSPPIDFTSRLGNVYCFVQIFK